MIPTEELQAAVDSQLELLESDCVRADDLALELRVLVSRAKRLGARQHEELRAARETFRSTT